MKQCITNKKGQEMISTEGERCLSKPLKVEDKCG